MESDFNEELNVYTYFKIIKLDILVQYEIL